MSQSSKVCFYILYISFFRSTEDSDDFLSVDVSESSLQVDLRDSVEEEKEEVEIVSSDSILTEHVKDVAYNAISDLARKVAIGKEGITLEDIVRSELKPLLRKWLDEHLPTVIEKLVKEELERVTSKVLDQ